jgi:hypothetical protein
MKFLQILVAAVALTVAVSAQPPSLENGPRPRPQSKRPSTAWLWSDQSFGKRLNDVEMK